MQNSTLPLSSIYILIDVIFAAMNSFSNKLKIFNDPIYGFVSLPYEIIYDLIDHPYFQRLRRIKQLGLTNLVYPGALHTRFHHAMGAIHLMGQAIDVIRSKGHEITEEEVGDKFKPCGDINSIRFVYNSSTKIFFFCNKLLSPKLI